MKWKPSDILIHKLSGECVMVLEVLAEETHGQVGGYVIRRQKDWVCVRVGEFELMERKTKK